MANLENLKKAWQSQSGISQERFDQIGSQVRDSSELLQKVVFRRDMLESLASVLVVYFFSVGLWVAKNWVAWSGFAIMVIAGITIPVVLWWARKRSLLEASAANFRDFVNIEIDYLRRQNLLLRMVAWWYLLPIYVGVLLIVVGLTDPNRMTLFEPIFLTVYLTLCAILFIFIWWLNQSARKKHVEPLINYYVQMQAALDSGDDFVMQMPDLPSVFLRASPPQKPISRLRRWTWIVLTVVVVSLVTGAGIATMQSFDARTGKFVLSTAPVVAILMIFVSGIWRRDHQPLGR